QSFADNTEVVRRDPDLEILVLACRSSEEEVERPARDHVPPCIDSRESPRELGRAPRVPTRELGVGQIHLRQRKRASCTRVDTTISPAETPRDRNWRSKTPSKFWP